MSPNSSKDIEVFNEHLPDQNVLPVEGKLCMCSLCTCGQHKCPPKHGFGASGFPPDTKSEYIQRYPAWPLAARKTHKPPPTPINEAPFSGLTTYHADFEKKKITQRQRHVPSGKSLENCIPTGKLNSAASEYATQFTKFPVQPRHPHQKPSNVQANSAPFDDRTTNKCDYKQWPLAIRAPIKQAESSKSDGVFDDITTYKVAFWDKSKNLKPLRRTEMPKLVESGPFYGKTTHAADYGPKPLLKKAPPLKHEPSLANPGAPFDGETTYHDKFRAWEIRKPVRSNRMKEALPMPSESFAGNTTYHTDFTAPRMPRRCPVLLRPKPIHHVGEHLCY